MPVLKDLQEEGQGFLESSGIEGNISEGVLVRYRFKDFVKNHLIRAYWYIFGVPMHLCVCMFVTRCICMCLMVSHLPACMCVCMFLTMCICMCLMVSVIVRAFR